MLLEHFLPVELVDKIYRIRHTLELNDVHKELIHTKKIVKGKAYILKRNNKQQVVTIDGYYRDTGKSKLLYSYYYGIFGFHEGFTVRENLYELTHEQQEHQRNGHYWKLPQEFYQSFPS